MFKSYNLGSLSSEPLSLAGKLDCANISIAGSIDMYNISNSGKRDIENIRRQKQLSEYRKLANEIKENLEEINKYTKGNCR